MKMFETHENEIGQKVSTRVGKSELRMAGGSIVSSGKQYFPIRWQQMPRNVRCTGIHRGWCFAFEGLNLKLRQKNSQVIVRPRNVFGFK
jgi:hypothetical protein